VEQDAWVTALSRPAKPSSGQPLAGAIVCVTTEDHLLDLRQNADLNHVSGTRTDVHGGFTFRQVAPGPLRLVIEHPNCGVFLHDVVVPADTQQWHERTRADECT